MNDSAVHLVVHLSLLLVLMEGSLRLLIGHGDSWGTAIFCFMISYCICLLFQSMGMKDWALMKSDIIRNVLSLSHSLDGLSALVIGLAIYVRNTVALVIGILVVSKYGLLHAFNRMILGKSAASGDWLDVSVQTTKSFLHHVASFLFLPANPSAILLTTAWRTLSMTGHALLFFRGRLSAASLAKMQWLLSYLRIVFLLLLLSLCLISSDLRIAFGRSAAGHIAYMAVRFVPLLQQGGVYVEAEKQHWVETLNNGERLQHLCKGNYPLLTTELALMAALSLLFASTRLILLGPELNAAASTMYSTLPLSL